MASESSRENLPSAPRVNWRYWQGTLRLLSQRIHQNPGNADSWTSRAILLKHLGDYEGAARDLGRALELDPASVFALTAQGNLLLALGRHLDAIAVFDRAVAIAPTDADTFINRGRGYFEQDRLAEAIADFTTAIGLSADSGSAYFNRAMARSREAIGDYAGALSDCDTFFRLVREPPEYVAEAHGLRAMVFEKLGLYREAIADYDVELQLTPHDATAYLARSRAHEMAGHQAEAAEDRKRATGGTDGGRAKGSEDVD